MTYKTAKRIRITLCPSSVAAYLSQYSITYHFLCFTPLYLTLKPMHSTVSLCKLRSRITHSSNLSVYALTRHCLLTARLMCSQPKVVVILRFSCIVNPKISILRYKKWYRKSHLKPGKYRIYVLLWLRGIMYCSV